MIWFDGRGLATDKPDTARVWIAKVISICVPTTAARVDDWLLLSWFFISIALIALKHLSLWAEGGKILVKVRT